MKTALGTVAVQIVYASRRNSLSIEHLDSARDDGELEALKAAARQRLGTVSSTWAWLPGLQSGQHTLTAAVPLLLHLHDALTLIKWLGGGH